MKQIQLQIFGRPYPSHIMGCSCFTFDALYPSVFPPAGETFVINLQMCKGVCIPLLYLTSTNFAFRYVYLTEQLM